MGKRHGTGGGGVVQMQRAGLCQPAVGGGSPGRCVQGASQVELQDAWQQHAHYLARPLLQPNAMRTGPLQLRPRSRS